MIRAATWAAVSSEAQNAEDKISIPDQQQAAKRKAEELGATVVAELIVPGISRELLDFPTAVGTIEAYAELKRLVDSRSIDLLIFLNRGRLGRTMSLIEGLVLFCLSADVALYDLSAPPSTLIASQQLHSGGDQLTGVIQSWRYQNEMSEIRRRNKIGMLNRVKRGDFASNIPYGWKRVYDVHGNARIEVDETAAELIRLIYDLYLSGLGRVKVADRLNELGHRTKTGKLWTMSNLDLILRQVLTHAGYVQLNRITRKSNDREYTIAKGKQPPIISEELAQRIIAEHTERAKSYRSVNTKYLFSRLVNCERCNWRMHVDKEYGAGSPYSGLNCAKCGRSISFLKVKQAFLEWFDHAADETVIEVVDTSATEQMTATIQRLQKQIDATEKAISRAHSAFVDGDMSREDYKAQVKRKETERAQLLAQLDEVSIRLRSVESHRQRVEQVADIVEVGKSMMEHADAAAANSWLREFFTVSFSEERSIKIRLK